MSSFVDGVVDGVRSAFCTFINVGERGTAFFNELSPLPDIPSYGPFWNRVLCDRNEPLPPVQPPFTGGQCPGELYEFRIIFAPDNPPGSQSSFIGNFVGPITGWQITGEEVLNPNNPDSILYSWRFTHANGVETGATNSSAGGITPTVSPVDGTDDCGDPPPTIPPFPPGGDIVSIDITYTNNEGNTVVELGDLTIFAPVVIAPVNIVAPIRVNLPDVSFNGQIVLSPRFDVVLNPPVSTDGPGEEGGDDEQPEPDDEKELIGVRVITQNPTTGAATTIFGQGAAPNLYVPRLATVQYEVRFENVTAWTEPVDIKAANQFVPAPKVGLVTRFVVNNIPNVTSVARPIFVPETPRCCE